MSAKWWQHRDGVSATTPGCAASAAAAACRRKQLSHWPACAGCCREQVLAKKAFHHMKTIKKVRPGALSASALD